ncbi:unnamed protein product [Tuber aestivum]|uniref:Uncharacterized protein n=1 Tax=Tuber aestivum TaxID=59557 RepID=A0A292PWV8_9PEZI|nr:unnamed protein product [Tuber aestivum]
MKQNITSSLFPESLELNTGKKSANSKRTFHGIVSVDGREPSIRSVRNWPTSGTPDALRIVEVGLDPPAHKEHATGYGDGGKAATFIELDISGINLNKEQRVRGIGIHDSTAQASSIAILPAASKALSSPPGTHQPMASLAARLTTLKQPGIVNINGPVEA